MSAQPVILIRADMQPATPLRRAAFYCSNASELLLNTSQLNSSVSRLLLLRRARSLVLHVKTQTLDLKTCDYKLSADDGLGISSGRQRHISLSGNAAKLMIFVDPHLSLHFFTQNEYIQASLAKNIQNEEMGTKR